MKSNQQKESSGAYKEDKSMRQSISSPPQLSTNPEGRRDFFNRLLEKYSIKPSRFGSQSPPSGSGFGQRSTRCTTVLTAKAPSAPSAPSSSKTKDKFLKKKKSTAEKASDKSAADGEVDSMRAWRNSVKNHVFDPSVYKNHNRIRNRFPCPMPTIEEEREPENSSDEGSYYEDAMSGGTKSYESINHSFTLLPCGGDQKPIENKSDKFNVKYEEKILQGKNPMPEELQPRHLSKSRSGTLIWVGNDIIHKIQKKINKKADVSDVAKNEPKPSKSSRVLEDPKSSGEGEKSNIKSRKGKVMKDSSTQVLEEKIKGAKQTLVKTKVVKPSSSSLPQLKSQEAQEEAKLKKLNEQAKKLKKLTKKQAFSVVRTKPSA